jgi:hypothetical protein
MTLVNEISGFLAALAKVSRASPNTVAAYRPVIYPLSPLANKSVLV